MPRPDDSSTFDWRSPDYAPVLQARAERLARLRADAALLEQAFAIYRDDPASFIHDWAVTTDPRVVGGGRSGTMPMLLMPRQRELVEWIYARWRAGEPGVLEKSRDIGASWLIMALSCTLCLFHRDINIGVGSRKEELVDLSGSPDCLLYKARFFLQNLPREFRQGWSVTKHSAHMRLTFPATGSAIVGEAGDGIGRGGRAALYFVDEAAFLERPKLIEASLIANTDCRIDVSSVNGMNNPFAEKRHSGRVPVFTFHYRDDLRKGAEWAERKRGETDEATWNSEYELDYLGSIHNALIKPEWVRAAVDAHVKLDLEPLGVKGGSLDPADEGNDLCAFGARHGNVVTHMETWSGKGSDMHQSTERAFMLSDTMELQGFVFDGDGLGAGVRAAVNQITGRRREQEQRAVHVTMFRGSAAVLHPEQRAQGTEVKNKDRFQNLKAQSWFALRDRFEATYRAVNGATNVNLDQIVSLSSGIKELNALCVELSLPVWRMSSSGRIVVEKYGEDGNGASPNRGDCLMMLMGQPVRRAMNISEAALLAVETGEEVPAWS